VSRYVVTKAVTVAFSSYLAPGRSHMPGQVLELSAAEVSAIGAGNLRAVSSSTVHDQLGEAAGISNGN
jgi:hypothetical protein